MSTKQDCCVYEWTHLPTGKKYVGKTNNADGRFTAHLKGRSFCSLFNNFFKGHPELVSWNIIFLCDDLSCKEALLVEGLRTRFLESQGYQLGKKLLNLKHGGEGIIGFKFTEEQRARHRLAMNRPDVVEKQRKVQIEAANKPGVKEKQSAIAKIVQNSAEVLAKRKITDARPEVIEKRARACSAAQSRQEVKEKIRISYNKRKLNFKNLISADKEKIIELSLTSSIEEISKLYDITENSVKKIINCKENNSERKATKARRSADEIKFNRSIAAKKAWSNLELRERILFGRKLSIACRRYLDGKILSTYELELLGLNQ